MKSIKLTDISAVKNELRKYKHGKKFDINQFNQVARLAWLGKLTLQPLDAQDQESRAMLVHVDYPDELIDHILNTDQDLVGHIHIVDGEQADALVKIMELGVRERIVLYQDLQQRDFYFDHFYKPSREDNQDRD